MLFFHKNLKSFMIILGLILGLFFSLWTDFLPVWLELFIYIYVLFCAFLFFIMVLLKIIPKRYFDKKYDRILIIAPHQDDETIIAGGYAAQVMERGGSVHILYTTDGYRGDKITRKNEALDAASVIGIPKENVEFLPHHTSEAFVDLDEINQGVSEISEYIKILNPQAVFLAEYEGGHHQHDVTNFMIRQSIKHNDFSKIDFYEASAYNIYFSFTKTPHKILSAFFRLLPGVTYDYPPESIFSSPKMYVKLTKEQLKKKQDMLWKFKTQNPDQLVRRFSFPEAFQVFEEYDYSKPPFNYEKSFVKILDDMKSWPLVGQYVKKAVVWTRTIHPDKNLKMTQIPHE